MPSAEEVREWIEWDRANPSPHGEYLVVSEVGSLDLPWAEAASEHFYKESAERERTLDVFARELVRDPTDVNARFVALHFYHLARAAAEMEVSEGVAEPDFWPPKKFGKEVPGIRPNFRQELAPLIGLLKVEECPAVWGFIEWEILNSCLVGNLDRIVKLLTRAEDEKLLDRALAQVFRGQYRFVAALEGTEELESQDWRPRLYKFPRKQDYADLVTGLRLFLLGIATRDSRPATDQSQVELLRDAAHDLEKAVAAIADVPPAYSAALARSYFGIGKFRAAADQYHRLLGVNLKLGEKADLHKAVYDCLVLAHEKAGDLAAAMQALAEEIGEYPREKGLWTRMAQFKAGEAQFGEVVECLRKEAENNPEVDKDWKVSALIALGEVHESPGELKRERPDLVEGVRWGLDRFWPPFHKVCAEAVKACLDGEFFAALSHHKELNPQRFSEIAAFQWAKAVEAELGVRVFHEFRSYVRVSPGLLAAAEAGLSSDKPFCEFLVWKHPRGLTLGEMQRVLRSSVSASSGDGIFTEFRTWLQREHRRFDALALVGDLEKINIFRRGEAHPMKGSGSPEETLRLCRDVLEKLTSNE
jgi:tetratricopeptide (TPR) repeat protein